MRTDAAADKMEPAPAARTGGLLPTGPAARDPERRAPESGP
jgi:hypothetical protein